MNNVGNLFGAGIIGGIQGGLNFGLTDYNNELAKDYYDYAAQQNYMYGEKSADRADLRTRLLYKDLYGPQAQLQQLKDAGLSASLFYGDGGGISGQTGAQGTGASGMMPNTFGVNPVDLAQIRALNAQADKSNAEAKNIDQDTLIKKLEESLKTLELSQYKNEWEIINSTWEDGKTGQLLSVFELAEQYYTYDSFIEAIRQEETDNSIKTASTTEAGQKILREIYTSASRFQRDISVLTSEQVNANFQTDIVQKLRNKNFVELNANAAIQELRTQISVNELTENQKEAWNNLLDRLGKKGSTMRDLIIVLAMIVGGFEKNSNIKLNTGGQTINVTKTGGE